MLSHIKTIAALVLVALVSATGCEHSEGPTGPEDNIKPTFSSIQSNIFSPTCATAQCHGRANPPQGLDLKEGQAYENLVGIQSNEKPQYLRVEPENPDSSYLIMKLEGSEKIIGQRMPAGQEPLSRRKINAIRTWIENGAEK